MRSVDEHLAAILSSLTPAASQTVSLAESLGLVVAGDVVARVDLPGFDNSSMDGYAVQSVSLAGAAARPVTLSLVGEVAAGDAPTVSVGKGEAVRIMTGAPMPEGADAVIAVEDTDGAATGSVECRAEAPVGRFVRRRGEDVAAGSVVVRAGDVVGPRTVALLAASGHATVDVVPRPHVVVLSTGAELVEPGQPLGPGQIHDSNSSMLWAAATRAGATAEIRSAVGDTDEELLAVVDEVVGVADAVVTSGGVSMGAYDVVKSALRSEGVDFVQVAMQPGKPQGFGFLAGPGGRAVPLFALPGNPVSSYVSFEVFVRPALRRLMGHADPVRPTRRAVLTSGLRSVAGRRQLARAVVTTGADGTLVAEPVAGQGSHFVADLSRANALLVIAEDTTEVGAGEVVDAILLDD
ncbi:molybdopterin molybdotransferase MoeA [Intrasporangium oryzae]|uniref:molybdopterin molybdotransferase MoeA n=1 Tax=Intrasporangium oryzae TaxID=412687 RepID=UPI0005513C37|nr:gephyrin-like molybdotransferase Glp [Intrasporangium oryzae]